MPVIIYSFYHERQYYFFFNKHIIFSFFYLKNKRIVMVTAAELEELSFFCESCTNISEKEWLTVTVVSHSPYSLEGLRQISSCSCFFLAAQGAGMACLWRCHSILPLFTRSCIARENPLIQSSGIFRYLISKEDCVMKFWRGCCKDIFLETEFPQC